MIRKDLGNVSGNVSIDCAEARAFEMVATGNITIGNPSNLPEWELVMVKILGDGVYTITWGGDYALDINESDLLSGYNTHATVSLYAGFRRFGGKCIETFHSRAY